MLEIARAERSDWRVRPAVAVRKADAEIGAPVRFAEGGTGTATGREMPHPGVNSGARGIPSRTQGPCLRLGKLRAFFALSSVAGGSS